MNATTQGFPRFQPVAEHAVLVELGETIDASINAQVRRLDAALAAAPFPGFTEAVPAYASLLVGFDPFVSDHGLVEAAMTALLREPATLPPKGEPREVLACYEDEFSPDLDAVAAATGLSREAVIAAHLAGDYSVFMYGFAPGYAYLAGVPEAIRLPRKPAPVRGIAAGSVLIAGPQCLVTTLVMPTGWHIIGRSPTEILREETAKPFLFEIGDDVRFRRIDRAGFDAHLRRA
jgi:inhibitor of KinA